MKKNIFLGLFLLVLLILPLKTSAQSSSNVNVAASIDSRVSRTLSTVTVSAHETLADPASHSILITIKLVDSSNNPLPNLNVVLTSSRGAADIIEAVSKIGTGATGDEMRTDKTDANGLVSFRISSFFPGKTTISILADQLISLDPVDLQFDPLPFPANITFCVSHPFPSKGTILCTPQPNKETGLSESQLQAQKLINLGTMITINFWSLLIIVLLAIFCPFFVIMNFIYIRKIRQMERETLVNLEKIKKKEDGFFRE